MGPVLSAGARSSADKNACLLQLSVSVLALGSAFLMLICLCGADGRPSHREEEVLGRSAAMPLCVCRPEEATV